MSDFIRQYPLEDGATSYISQLGRNSNAHNVHAGYGIKMTHTAHGTRITNTILPKNDATIWKGNFDPTAEYFPYDEIFVSSTTNYTDPYSSNNLNLTPGTYICTNYIPPSINTSQSFYQIVTAMGVIVGNDMANSYRWPQWNNYYPTAQQYTQGSQSYGVYVIATSQSFWQPIGSNASINYYFYNESASYNKNDIIFVSYNSQFTTSFITPSGSNTAPLCPGTFIAAQSVPAAPSSGSTTVGISGSSWNNLRTPYNYYYPIWPIWPVTSSIHTTVGADGGVSYSGSVCNQIYWNPIAPEILLQICVNGNNVNAGVMGEMSGSVFDLTQLAYSGSGV